MLLVTLPTEHTAGPPPSPVAPMHSPLGRKNWKYRIRRWIPKPPNWISTAFDKKIKLLRWIFTPSNWIFKRSVWAFITLIVVAGLSFIPLRLYRLEDPVRLASTEDLNDTNYVVLFGDISRFNWGDTEKVSVQWSLWASGGYKRNPEIYKYDVVDRAVDVYINNASQPIFSYDPALLPTYAAPGSGDAFPANLYSFKVEHDTFTCAPRHDVPNDCYFFSAFAFIIEKATNDSVPTAFGVDNSGSNDFAAQSYGQASRNHFSHIISGEQTTGEVESVTMDFLITRSKRAKALTYFMLVVNWLLTVGAMVTTALTFSRRGKLKDGIALVPLMLILTIPTIRNFYPGAPPLGIFLDFVGLFPQMLSVAMCIVVALIGIALKRPKDKSINEEVRLGDEPEDLQHPPRFP